LLLLREIPRRKSVSSRLGLGTITHRGDPQTMMGAQTEASGAIARAAEGPGGSDRDAAW